MLTKQIGDQEFVSRIYKKLSKTSSPKEDKRFRRHFNNVNIRKANRCMKKSATCLSIVRKTDDTKFVKGVQHLRLALTHCGWECRPHSHSESTLAASWKLGFHVPTDPAILLQDKWAQILTQACVQMFMPLSSQSRKPGINSNVHWLMNK